MKLSDAENNSLFCVFFLFTSVRIVGTQPAKPSCAESTQAGSERLALRCSHTYHKEVIINEIVGSSMRSQRTTIYNNNHKGSTSYHPMKKNSTPPAAAPIPMPTSHIKRTHSELQLAQDQLLADYQDGQMYERISKFITCCSSVLFCAPV